MQKKTEKLPGGHLLFILAAVCALALFVMAWALLQDTGADNAAFTPPPFEENARQGEPEVSQEIGYSLLDAQEYEVGICGAPVMEDGSAVLYLTNPASNTVWLKVRILDESGQVLGESGLLKPGEYVETVGLTDMPEEHVEMVELTSMPEEHTEAKESANIPEEDATKGNSDTSEDGNAGNSEDGKAGASSSGQTGDIAVVLKIMAYEPDTYYSAGVASLSTTLRTGA